MCVCGEGGDALTHARTYARTHTHAHTHTTRSPFFQHAPVADVEGDKRILHSTTDSGDHAQPLCNEIFGQGVLLRLDNNSNNKNKHNKQ